MNLKNKVVVVTGASDGIGREVALALADTGASLALLARNKDRLEKVKVEINKQVEKANVQVYPCDIRKTEQLEEVVQQIVSDFTHIDVLLNIAGVWQKHAPIEEISEEIIGGVIETNLIGLIHCTRLIMPYLKKQPEAIIVNVSSKSGVVAQTGQSVYTASKYGVKGFTDVLKVDLEKTTIRVAGVYQSGTNTQMFAKTGEVLPIEKFTEPKDLAQVILFMLTRPKKIWIHEIQVEY